MRRPHGVKAAQRGAALLLAMLTVTLVASLAASALWQQWRGIEIESSERTRVQAGWVLTGALDWARLILREDARNGGADHLGEPWAVPLQESRLSTFLAADRNNNAGDTDDALDVFLSGQLSDLQARLNLLNLVEDGRTSEITVRAFVKLFDLLGLPPQEVYTLAENMRFAADSSPDNRSAGFAPLMPQRVEQLVWLGLPQASVDLIRPYVTMLPTRTPVNLNTASAEVLYACIPSLDMTQARKLVSERATAHFRSLADAGRFMENKGADLADGQHSVATRYFEVLGRLRMDQAIVEERSVLQRDNLDVKTLSRERVASQVQAPGTGRDTSLQ